MCRHVPGDRPRMQSRIFNDFWLDAEGSGEKGLLYFACPCPHLNKIIILYNRGMLIYIKFAQIKKRQTGQLLFFIFPTLGSEFRILKYTKICFETNHDGCKISSFNADFVNFIFN